jgi:uncharacterized protein with GYD domain
MGGIILVVERWSPRGKWEEGGSAMPRYISLLNWTDQGIRNVRDTVQRRDQADALAEKHGARIEQVYWTVGPYDIVTIVEAPDDDSATAMLLELGSAGNLRTTTLRAYDRDEMSGIVQRLG